MNSKRKIDDVHGRNAGGPKAKTPTTTITGWGALPPELIRRVGQFHGDPESLAGMERTCKLWRMVVIEGNQGLSVDDKPSLWRDLALTNFPAFHSIVKVLPDSAQFSWKYIYRSRAVMYSPAPYQPRTKIEDYIFTFEFNRHTGKPDKSKTAFRVSNRGFESMPTLWNQVLEVDEEEGEIRCIGPLDPNLVSRLGKDPFDFMRYDGPYISANVYVTRLSDMSTVDLACSMYYDSDMGDWPERLWFSAEGDDDELPLGRVVANEDDYFEHCDTIHPYFHVYGYRLELTFYLESRTGRVGGFAVDKIRDNSVSIQRQQLSARDILMYLEVECPWKDHNGQLFDLF